MAENQSVGQGTVVVASTEIVPLLPMCYLLDPFALSDDPKPNTEVREDDLSGLDRENQGTGTRLP